MAKKGTSWRKRARCGRNAAKIERIVKRKKRMPAARSADRVRSVPALALAMGRDPTTIRRWLKRDDWPLPRVGPWSVRAVQRFAATLEPDSGAVDDLRAARKALIETKTELARRQLSEAAGATMQRADVEALLVRRAHAMKAHFLRLPRELSESLVGLTAVAIEARLDEAVRGALNAWAES